MNINVTVAEKTSKSLSLEIKKSVVLNAVLKK